MIITASGIPVEQYPLAKKVGLDTVWNGDPKMAKRNGLWCVCDSAQAGDFQGKSGAPTNVVGLNWGDDYPVDELPGLEVRIQDAKRWTNIQWHIVLISATYTRMLDYLGADTIEEYYRAFAELCPSAIPMLCHYPWHDFLEETTYSDIAGEYKHWCTGEYLYNLALMEKVFGRRWWAWVQLSPHRFYHDSEGVDHWIFRELEDGELEYQTSRLIDHGCSGLGYFCWGPLKGDGIVDKDGEPSRHFETIREINEEAGK